MLQINGEALSDIGDEQRGPVRQHRVVFDRLPNDRPFLAGECFQLVGAKGLILVVLFNPVQPVFHEFLWQSLFRSPLHERQSHRVGFGFEKLAHDIYRGLDGEPRTDVTAQTLRTAVPVGDG